MPDSRIANNGGSGRVDQAKLRKIAGDWGRMTERQRAQAMQEIEELTNGLSLAHQQAFRTYFQRLLDEQARKAGSR